MRHVPSVFLAIAKYRVMHSWLSPRVYENHQADHARFTEVFAAVINILSGFEKAIQGA